MHQKEEGLTRMAIMAINDVFLQDIISLVAGTSLACDRHPLHSGEENPSLQGNGRHSESSHSLPPPHLAQKETQPEGGD